jgi:UDPglucose 6-dehydrogenase
MQKITIIGTGYVGLVTGVCLASKGNQVICVDNNPKIITKLESGVCTIYEAGLESLLQQSIKEGNISFTADTIGAVESSEVIFFCLPTPQGADGSADLSFVKSVTNQIAPYLKNNQIIVNKSTVPIGTGDIIEELIRKARPEIKFAVLSNPEFLKEGVAVNDFLYPERVVIGDGQKWALERIKDLYKPFTDNIILTDRRSSEMIKYAANSFLATKISFMNEIANLCEHLGADIEMVKEGIGSDPRIGSLFLNPSIGYGGSCFPKDVSALINIGYQEKYHLRILDAVTQVNIIQKAKFVSKIAKHYNYITEGLKLAVWGLTFKKNTDDVRDSPAYDVIHGLINAGVEITAFDPEGAENFIKYFPDLKIKIAPTKEECLEKANGLVILTEWDDFKNIDYAMLKTKMSQNVIFDGRNLLNKPEVIQNGFIYYGIGR